MFRVPHTAPKLLTYSEWLVEAMAILESKHNTRASTIRPRTWVNWYVRGWSPEEAAQRAATAAFNALPADERFLKPH
jgi:hypothetical protein